MVDEIDMAEQQQQRLLDAAVENAQKKSRFEIEGNGVCIVCSGIVKPIIVNNRSIIGRFCSIECRDEFGRSN